MTDYVDINGLTYYDGLLKTYIDGETAAADAAVAKLGFTQNVSTLPSSGTTSWSFVGGVYLMILQNVSKTALMGAYLLFVLSSSMVIEPLHEATGATLTTSGTTLTIHTTTSGTVGFIVWPLTARSEMPTAAS